MGITSYSREKSYKIPFLPNLIFWEQNDQFDNLTIVAPLNGTVKTKETATRRGMSIKHLMTNNPERSRPVLTKIKHAELNVINKRVMSVQVYRKLTLPTEQVL